MERGNISNYDQQQEMAPYTEFFSWGSDQYGQLALANSDEEDQNQYYPPAQYYEEPKSLSFDIIISSISCGDQHAAFISGDGFLFSFGRNTEGQLGVGDPSLVKSSAPLLVDSLPQKESQILQVSCGGSHTAVLLGNGDIYTWGQGQNGATGLNTQQNTFAPLKVKTVDNQNTSFTYVSCGKRHTMAIDIEGQLLVCGDNSFRQLGISHTEKVLTLRLVPTFYKKALKVAAGVEHSLILTKEGELYAAGNNSQGNLGLGHTYSSDSFLQVHGLQTLLFSTISAGRHSAAITDDNRLFVWGPVFLNENALILPQELRSNKMIKWVDIGELMSAIVDEDYHLYTWGNISQGDIAPEEGQMPQFVESLAYKQVTQAGVGLDFIIALGQDFDQTGQIMPRDFNLQQEQNPYPKEVSPPQSFQNQNNYQSYPKSPDTTKSYDPVQQPKPQEDISARYEPKSQNKPPLLKNPEKNQASSTFDYDYQRRSDREPVQVENKNNFSQISSSSKKSNALQNNRPNYEPKDESSFHSSQVAFDRNSSSDRFKQTAAYNQNQPVIGTASTIGLNYASNTNADLYKQIDQLREENFQLKGKQRELMKALNEIKAENDALLQNADSEIKRMSDFVDKYTQDVETNKKKMQQEFEEKIQLEKKKGEELKQRLHKEQNDIEDKLDKLQREIENQRQENLTVQQQKYDAVQRQKELQDQLNIANQQLKQALQQPGQIQSSDRERNFSPLGQSTPLQTKSIKFDDSQKQTTPGSYNQRPPVNNPPQQERSNPRVSNNRQQDLSQDIQQPTAPRGFSRGGTAESTQQYNTNTRPTYQQEEPKYSRQQKEIDPSQNFFTIDQKNSYSPFTNGRQQRNEHTSSIGPSQSSQATTSNNKMPVIISPQRQQQPPQEDQLKRSFIGVQDQQQLPPKYNDDRSQLDDYRRDNFGGQLRGDTSNIGSGIGLGGQKENPTYGAGRGNEKLYQQPPVQQDRSSTKIYDYNSGQYSSLQNRQYTPVQDNNLQNSNNMGRRETPIDQKYIRNDQQFADEQQPLKGKENPTHSRGSSTGGEDKNALNDVKNRLLIMQRNKEELEEKLRNYENKIRQHYNRQ